VATYNQVQPARAQGFDLPAETPRIGEAEAAAAAHPAGAYSNPAPLPAPMRLTTPNQVRLAATGMVQRDGRLRLAAPAPAAATRGDALNRGAATPSV